MQEDRAKGEGEGTGVFEHLLHPRPCTRHVTRLFSLILIATLCTKYIDPHLQVGKLWFREGDERVQGHTANEEPGQV